jgi:hypothetical protein
MSLATLRMLDPTTLPKDRRSIEDVVLHKYFKDYILPSVEEGFAEVVQVPWVAQGVGETTGTPEERRLRAALLHMYLR